MVNVISLYAGFDPREEIGYHTFCSSVIHNSSEPVHITPLYDAALSMDGQRDGTNRFIYLRFLIPYLQGYQGWAIFCDGSDMIVKDDIAKLWAMRDYRYAVQVVQHNYETKHARKYVGTAMEADNGNYPCKNWSSVMLINCAHPDWREISPDTVKRSEGSYLHRFMFLDPKTVGTIPITWNWLADEFGENNSASLLHWTAGIPAWDHYKDAPHAEDWRAAHARVNHAI